MNLFSVFKYRARGDQSVFLTLSRSASKKSFIPTTKIPSRSQKYVLNKQQTKRNREKRYGLSEKILQLGKTNQLERAINLFDNLIENERRVKPNIVLVNSLMTACKNAGRFSHCWEIFKKWIVGHDILHSQPLKSPKYIHTVFAPDEASIVIILDSMVKAFGIGINMFGDACKNVQELKDIYRHHMIVVKEIWFDSNKEYEFLTSSITNNLLRLIGRIGDDYNDILNLVSRSRGDKDVTAVKDPDIITFHTIMQGLVYLNAPSSILQHYFALSCRYKLLDIHLVNRLILGLIKHIRHKTKVEPSFYILEKTKRLLQLCHLPEEFIKYAETTDIYTKLFENISSPKLDTRSGEQLLSCWFLPKKDISEWNIKPNKMTHSLVLQVIRMGNIKGLYCAYSDRFTHRNND